MSFWSELKRRNVVKVAIAYLVVAWLIVQVANTFFPILNLPTWAVTLVAVLVILGFPLALLFAWAFELTPEGLKKTEHVPLEESITHITGQKLNYILIGVIVLAVAYILFDNLYLDKLAIQTEVESRVAELVPPAAEEEAAQKTIAVLPFVNMSPDPEQDSFADGLSEEILNSLNKIPDLLVTARTSSFAFKGKDLTVKDIAPILGVANVLEGSVRKAGNKLRVTAQLIRAADGFHLWSNQYDRELKDIEDILSIQGDIARNVANELKASLGVGESLKQLGGTDDVEAYQLYLIAKGQYRALQHERALLSINEAISLDQEFALAWVLKSQILGGAAYNSSDDQWALILEESANAAQKAIELEPKLAAGHYALGQAKVQALKWLEAQLAFNKALEYTTDPLLRYEVKDPFYYQVLGYLEKAKIMLEEVLLNDPLNNVFRDNYIFCLALMGDYQAAEEEYKKDIKLFNNPNFHAYTISFARLGTNNALSSDDFPYSSPIWNVAKDYLKSPKDGLIELNRIYRDNNNLTEGDMMDISLWAVYFGDPEFAVKAMKKAGFHRVGRIRDLWLPAYQKVRQLPQFKEIVREIGFVDYWEQFGWPDLCHETDDGDFECD